MASGLHSLLANHYQHTQGVNCGSNHVQHLSCLDDGVNGVKCTFREFADDTKLRGVADPPNGCASIQRGLDRLQKWADRNPMKLNKEMWRPGPGKEQVQASIYTRGHPAGKQLGRKGPGGHQLEHQSVCARCKVH